MFIGFDHPAMSLERVGDERFQYRAITRETQLLTGRVIELKPQIQDGDALLVGAIRTSGTYGKLLRFSTHRTETIIADAFATNTEIIVRGWVDPDGHLHIKEATFA